MATTPSPLKFPGGKGKLVDEILARLGPGVRYIEPFCGSAIVGLNAPYRQRVLADTNADIIDVLRWCRDEPQVLIDSCHDIFAFYGNNREGYSRARMAYNRQLECKCQRNVVDSAIFIYLNRHCYNGLVRYNRKGGFNTSFGSYDPNPEPPVEQIMAAHASLVRGEVQLVCQEFMETCSTATFGDVVYMDPPYLGMASTDFSGYWNGSFADTQHKEVHRTALLMASRGAGVVVSAAKNERSYDIYSAGAQETHVVTAPRSISRNGSGRGKVEEYLFVY